MLNIQPPTKANIDRWITEAALEAQTCITKWHNVYTQIIALTDADLTTLGYNANDIYAIRQACSALENLYRHYAGETLLDQSAPGANLQPVTQAQY